MFQRLGALLFGVLCCAWFIPTAAAQQGESLSEQVNRGTVGIISGGVDGTYIRIASDLATVLDKRGNLGVLPVIGKGSIQNITDILYLKGIDIGIVQSDVLAHIKRENIHQNIEQKIHYITKLYNEEFHILAGDGIEDIQDLAEKKVNIGVRGSGTFMTASIVFDILNIPVVPVAFDQALALEKVMTGEIAAMVYVAGKPTRLFSRLRAGDGVHFLPIPDSTALEETYFPSPLTNEDYPHLIPRGEAINTYAVGAVMAVYNWKPNTARYRKVSSFIGAFFSRLSEFHKSPRHPKWKQVNLAAKVPGWTRFRAAEDWLR